MAGRWEAEVRRWRPEAAGPVPSRVSWEWLEVVGRVEGSGKTSAREALGGGGARRCPSGGGGPRAATQDGGTPAAGHQTAGLGRLEAQDGGALAVPTP